MRRNGIKKAHIVLAVVVGVFIVYFFNRITALSGISNYDISAVPRGEEHTDLLSYKAHAASGEKLHQRRKSENEPEKKLDVTTNTSQYRMKYDNMKNEIHKGLKKSRDFIGQLPDLMRRKFHDNQGGSSLSKMLYFNMDQFNISVNAIANLMSDVDYLREMSNKVIRVRGAILSARPSANSFCECPRMEADGIESHCRCCVQGTLEMVHLDKMICANFTYHPESRQMITRIIYDEVLVGWERSALDETGTSTRVCSKSSPSKEDKYASFPMQLCAYYTNLNYTSNGTNVLLNTSAGMSDEKGRAEVLMGQRQVTNGLLSGCLQIIVRVRDRQLGVYFVGCFGGLKLREELTTTLRPAPEPIAPTAIINNN